MANTYLVDMNARVSELLQNPERQFYYNEGIKSTIEEFLEWDPSEEEEQSNN